MYSSAAQDLLGKVMGVEVEERGRKSYQLPVLVVLPSADTDTALPTKQHVLVRSFRDAKL